MLTKMPETQTGEQGGNQRKSWDWGLSASRPCLANYYYSEKLIAVAIKGFHCQVNLGDTIGCKSSSFQSCRTLQNL